MKQSIREGRKVLEGWHFPFWCGCFCEKKRNIRKWQWRHEQRVVKQAMERSLDNILWTLVIPRLLLLEILDRRSLTNSTPTDQTPMFVLEEKKGKIKLRNMSQRLEAVLGGCMSLLLISSKFDDLFESHSRFFYWEQSSLQLRYMQDWSRRSLPNPPWHSWHDHR